MLSLVQQLCDRCVDRCEADSAAGCVALSQLRAGQRGYIMGFIGESDQAVGRRLFDLGFATGVEIEMIRKAPLRDPLMFRVAGGEMLLRRGEASKIVVKVA